MKQDITAKCVESGCGKEFVITVDDQKHCELNKYPLPKRCKPCRLVKRDRIKQQEIRNNSPFKGIFDQMKRGEIHFKS